MDLWIRSQDKTKLVKVNDILYMDTSEDYEKEYHSLWNNCVGILGTYKSKERAIEVLDEIQQHINNMLSINFAPSDYVKTILDFVYEMPKE